MFGDAHDSIKQCTHRLPVPGDRTLPWHSEVRSALLLVQRPAVAKGPKQASRRDINVRQKVDDVPHAQRPAPCTNSYARAARTRCGPNQRMVQLHSACTPVLRGQSVMGRQMSKLRT